MRFSSASPHSPSDSQFTNGHTSNGKIPTHNNGSLLKPNGKSVVPKLSLPGTSLYPDSNVNRQEFVRFVIQALRDVGYHESAATLEAESGYQLESHQVSHFRDHVLNGAWDEAESELSSLGASSEEALQDARFLINRQRYLELLEARRTTEALHVLRNKLAHLTPLESDSDPLQPLSNLIMCLDPEDVRQRAHWDGASGTSRTRLLQQIQQYISPSVMVPQRRLATLLEQARQWQHSNCPYHNAPSTDYSLYADHQCDISSFPRDTTTILEGHTDEVWGIAWSHDGLSLASAGKDKKAIIWHLGPEKDPAVREWKVAHILRDHPDPVGCLAWSIDDQVLLTGSEHQIKLWNVKTGLCTKLIEAHTDAVSGLAYLPDGSGFISAGLDRHVYQWDPDGVRVDAWGPTSTRITDLALTQDGTKLVTLGMQYNNQMRPTSNNANNDDNNGHSHNHSHNTQNAYQSSSSPPPTRMIVYDLPSKAILSDVDFEGELTSVNVSRDSQFAVLNHAPDEIQIWDLVRDRLVAKLHGQKQGTHIIRSCFGGMDDNFVASGSEDGNVYIWHRHSEALIEVLPGHGSGCLNVVAWNPVNERMFATCSDDHTIRIWEGVASSSSSTSFPPSSSGVPMSQMNTAPMDPKGKGKTRWDVDGVNAISSTALRATLSPSPPEVAADVIGSTLSSSSSSSSSSIAAPQSTS